jgi:ribonuclease-3
MAEPDSLATLEEAIGYRFRNPELLAEAFVHASFASDAADPRVVSNQRLEFLGDAALDLVVSRALFAAHPDWDEGRLTEARATFVSAKGLSAAGRELGLGRYLLVSRGEDLTGGRDRDSNLADAFEALVGAVYLDGGLEEAALFVRDHLLGGREEGDPSPGRDPKSALQEIVQANGGEPPTYRLIESSGPGHCPTFVMAVESSGRTIGTGEGSTKKAAERAAAADALLRTEWLRRDG